VVVRRGRCRARVSSSHDISREVVCCGRYAVCVSSGGGTLDAEELKDGLKMLVDSAKRNLGDVATLEKQALHLRRNAAQQILGLHKQEKERADRLKREVEAAAAAERELAAKEAAEAAAVAQAKADAEARKKADRAALLAKVAEQKKAARARV
jgi:hypothetical protein